MSHEKPASQMSGDGKTEVMTPSLDKARAHVEANMVGVTNVAILCGDGRYGVLQLPGSRRIFGTDTGLLVPAVDVVENHRQELEAAGIHMAPEDYAQGYLRAIKRWRGEAAVIETHADKHHAEPTLGCGYEKNSSTEANEPIYNTTNSPVIGATLSYVDSMPSTQKRTTIVDAEDHVELADIVIEAPVGEKVKWSVNSQNRAGTEMYFVEDATRAQEALRELRPLLEEEWGLPQGILTDESFAEAFQRFRIGTAAILAGGKPIYRFTIDRVGEIVTAEDLGTIPTKEQVIESHKS